MKKYLKLLLYPVLFIIIYQTPSFSWDKKSANTALKQINDLSIAMDKNKKLNNYYPYNIYQNAMTNLKQAQAEYNDSEYDVAFFCASLAKIQLEKAIILAETQRNSFYKLLLEKKFYKALSKKNSSKPSNQGDLSTLEAILDANLQKKGKYYNLELPDKNIFVRNTFYLDKEGQTALDKILVVLQLYPTSEIKIVGHTSTFDEKRQSDYKANVVANYFMKKEIDPKRIETLGIGNVEVMETPIGYRRVDRVELIITGLE